MMKEEDRGIRKKIGEDKERKMENINKMND